MKEVLFHTDHDCPTGDKKEVSDIVWRSLQAFINEEGTCKEKKRGAGSWAYH